MTGGMSNICADEKLDPSNIDAECWAQAVYALSSEGHVFWIFLASTVATAMASHVYGTRRPVAPKRRFLFGVVAVIVPALITYFVDGDNVFGLDVAVRMGLLFTNPLIPHIAVWMFCCAVTLSIYPIFMRMAEETREKTMRAFILVSIVTLAGTALPVFGSRMCYNDMHLCWRKSLQGCFFGRCPLAWGW